MSFISYAQNFEDVMLWRALKDVECGFYIDVGANDPEVDSVTKAFYDRGWRGINIEPIKQWYDKLQEQRPRDINLSIAAGDQNGEIVVYELPDTGLSTCDKTTAERHVKERGYKMVEHKTPTKTLKYICQKYHLSPIHFLKIDVEGAEKRVLEGIDFEIVRPWIIVVESTIPNTPIEDCETWEEILLKNRYKNVYFDGLNRFYLEKDKHLDLEGFFNSPPNVFDDFVLSGTASHSFHGYLSEKIDQLSMQASEQQQRAEAAETQASEQQQRAEAAETQASEQQQRAEAAETQASEQQQRAEAAEAQASEQQQRAEAAETQKQLAEHAQIAIYNSRSWRITKLLRHAGQAARWFRRGATAWLTFAPQSRPRRSLRLALMHLKLYVSQRPRLKHVILKCLQPFPRIESHLRHINGFNSTDFSNLVRNASPGGNTSFLSRVGSVGETGNQNPAGRRSVDEIVCLIHEELQQSKEIR